MSDIHDILHAVVEEIGGTPRSGQDDMADAVLSALNNDGHLLVQAGTGTGKSFGYLVPAMVWSAKTGNRAVISTATIALQRQIMTKDAPRVADVVSRQLGSHLDVAVLKGWNNYVCLRKATGGYPEEGTLLSRAESEYGATATGEEVVRARDWAMSSDTGDRDDLVPGVSDRVWAQLSVPKRECLGDSCPLRSSCFPMQAKAAADEADIVVTNHSMLGIAATGTPVLPDAQAYIVDEAHELIDRVTSQLTQTLSKHDLTSIARMLRRAGLADEGLDDAAAELNDQLIELDEGRITALDQTTSDVISRIAGKAQAAGEAAQGLSTGDEQQAITKQIIRSRLQEISDICEDVMGDAFVNGDLVGWTSVNDDVAYLSLAPLDVAGSIADSLFEGMPAVLTSATLKINDSFDAMATRVGFTFPSQGPWEGIDVGSPFVPEKQGVLYVAAHLPSPGGAKGYGNEQLDEMVDLVRAARGGTLGLFTSRIAAERAAEYVRDRVDTKVLLQGEDQLSTLVSDFAADDSASLFGTLSLWQGVDVPGRTLRLVIIDRIPFPRPNDPLSQARKLAADKAGRNGFMSVNATNAALLLAQGSGRLLRRTTDRGMVAVLDPRLRHARYAGFLLSAMPPMWRTTDPAIARAILGRLASVESAE